MTVRRAVHTPWFIVRPSADVPGDWEAHCLEFDLFAQGQTLNEAVALCVESAQIHIRESLRDGCDPYSTRAPANFWSFRDDILDVGERLDAAQLKDIASSGAAWVIAAEIPVVVDIDFHVVDGSPEKPPGRVLMWKKAA